MPQVPVGEAVFFGIWYGTLLALSIAVWIIAIQTIKVAAALIGMREWLSHLAITEASQGKEPPR